MHRGSNPYLILQCVPVNMDAGRSNPYLILQCVPMNMDAGRSNPYLILQCVPVNMDAGRSNKCEKDHLDIRPFGDIFFLIFKIDF